MKFGFAAVGHFIHQNAEKRFKTNDGGKLGKKHFQLTKILERLFIHKSSKQKKFMLHFGIKNVKRGNL